jgi:hypothetical protein
VSAQHLADQQVNQLREKGAGDLLQKVREKGCLLCGGKLRPSDYDRLPRSPLG